MTESPNPEGARARELDSTAVFHSWSTQGGREAIALAGGLGSTVWDHDGRRYLDFASQLVNVNIGHQHPAVVDAIKRQAETLATVAPNHANLARGEAARRILDLAGPGFSRVFFTNGGADAVENAIRMARLATGRDTVLSAYRSYHGNTGSAIAATGDWRRIPNQFARGHVHFFGPHLYRSDFWAASPEEESQRALRHLERVIEAEGPSTVAAIILEPVPGSSGVLVPPAGYLPGVRELASRHGILLILDEVMSGFGRAGEWFAHRADFGDGRESVTADLMTFAKGSNSGYVPAGGVVVSVPIANAFSDRVFPGGLTYSGHPLAMAAIVASIDAMRAEGIVEHAATIGTEHLGPGLRALAETHPVIGDVRGLGVFWALELVDDPDARTPASAAFMGELGAELLARGFLPLIVENRIHVTPPCVVTPAEVARGLALLDEAVTAVEQR